MTSTYTAVCQTTFTTNIDTVAIEIIAPANKTVKIKKIRVMNDDGTATTTADYYRNVKLITESFSLSGGQSYTPLSLDANATPAISTVSIPYANTTNSPGPTSRVIDTLSIHSNTDFLWSAKDEEDKITLSPGEIFAIVVNPGN